MKKALTKLIYISLGLTMAVGAGVAIANNVKTASPVEATAGDWSWSGTAAPAGFTTGESQSNTINGLTFTTTVTYSSNSSGWVLSTNDGKTTASFTTTGYSYHVDSIQIDWATNSKKRLPGMLLLANQMFNPKKLAMVLGQVLEH